MVLHPECIKYGVAAMAGGDPYLRYKAAQRPALQRANPGLSGPELNVLISAGWDALSHAEREKARGPSPPRLSYFI